MNETEANPTKTVLHLIDTTGPGGAETVFTTLLKELQYTNFQNVVVLRGEGWVADTVRSVGITPHIIDSKGSFNLRYVNDLKKLIAEEKVDLIHAHLLGSNVYGALLALICRKPMIATFHGSVDIAARERFLKAKFFLIGLGASKIVCVSKRLQQQLASRSNLPSRKLKLIYNGVDPAKFETKKEANLKKELGLTQDAKLVVSIGNIRPAKGYEYLVSASAMMSEMDPEVHFVVVGHQKKELFEQLMQQVSELAHDARLHWLGFREDVVEILQQADVFVLPSVSEGFSIATVEAMMAGVPVIATRSGGPEEILTDGESGFLIPVRDSSAIVAAISALKAPEVRERVVAQARRVAYKNFSLATMLKEYRGLYRQLIN